MCHDFSITKGKNLLFSSSKINFTPSRAINHAVRVHKKSLIIDWKFFFHSFNWFSHKENERKTEIKKKNVWLNDPSCKFFFFELRSNIEFFSFEKWNWWPGTYTAAFLLSSIKTKILFLEILFYCILVSLMECIEGKLFLLLKEFLLKEIFLFLGFLRGLNEGISLGIFWR